MNSRYPLNWRLGNLHIRPSCSGQKNLGHSRELKPDFLVVQAISFTVFKGFRKNAIETIRFVISVCLYVRPSLLCVRPSTWNNSATTGCIFVKFDI